MEFKKSMLILITAIFLISIAGVCASDVNDTMVTSEDTDQMDLSSNNEITEDNLQTIEENAKLTQADDDETVIAETDSEILTVTEGNYSDLRTDINNGGNLTKSYYIYHEGDGGSIEITTDDMVINGNGAVIDMAGSTISAFSVGASGVTIKNLTIKNAKNNGNGGAIHFNNPGTVIDCSFINNSVSYTGGAVYFNSNGDVTNCNLYNYRFIVKIG